MEERQDGNIIKRDIDEEMRNSLYRLCHECYCF